MLQFLHFLPLEFLNIKILLSKSVCKNHNNQTSHHVSASSFPSPVHSTQFATPNLRLPMLTSRITITIIHDHRLQTIFMFNTSINHGQFRSNHLLIPSKKKKFIHISSSSQPANRTTIPQILSDQQKWKLNTSAHAMPKAQAKPDDSFVNLWLNAYCSLQFPFWLYDCLLSRLLCLPWRTKPTTNKRKREDMQRGRRRRQVIRHPHTQT